MSSEKRDNMSRDSRPNSSSQQEGQKHQNGDKKQQYDSQATLAKSHAGAGKRENGRDSSNGKNVDAVHDEEEQSSGAKEYQRDERKNSDKTERA